MPSAPPRLCKCGGKVREGVCSGCGSKRRAKDENRANSHQRGYDHRWREFRARYLAEHPLCEDCLPRVTPATDVHHRQKLCERPDLKFDKDNLMPLCHECHSVRTARGE